MVFSQNLAVLRAAQARLQERGPADPMGRLVLAGLELLISTPERYDAAIVSGHSFTKHFLEALARPALTDEGCWLELFEDIALFVREKTLRPPHEGVTPVEQQILHMFESCGEWHPDDGTQVSSWFWRRLPKLAGKGPVAMA